MGDDVIREAQWVTEMKRHFAKYGFYRREDLTRLLGNPGDSVQVMHDGKVVYRSGLDRLSPNLEK